MSPAYLESSLIPSAKTSYSWQFMFCLKCLIFTLNDFFLGFSSTKCPVFMIFFHNFPFLYKTSKIICNYKNIPSWFSKWTVTEKHQCKFANISFLNQYLWILSRHHWKVRPELVHNNTLSLLCQMQTSFPPVSWYSLCCWLQT